MNFYIDQLFKQKNLASSNKKAHLNIVLVFSALTCQAILGILTVWNSVPLKLAHDHQVIYI
jgi:heme A synthase